MARRTTGVKALFVAALLPIALTVVPSAQAPASELPISTRASQAWTSDPLVQAAAAAYRLDPSNLRLLSGARTELPLTQVTLLRGKVLDKSSGQIYGVTLNSSGKVLRYSTAREAEAAAYKQRFGTMDLALVRKVNSSSASERIPVAFWLKSDHNNVVTRQGIDRNASLSEIDAVEQRDLKALQAAVGKVTGRFTSALRARGIDVTSVARYSPAVFATVPAGQVSKLASDSRVQATSFAGARAYDYQNIAKTTTAATKVWAKGITGASSAPGGPNVGVVECCDSTFEENTADLDAENNYFLARLHEGRAAACPGDHSHPTAVSGIIASTHPQTTGIGSNSHIYFNSAASCGGGESELVTAAENVSANVSGPTNHSYGATPSTPCPGVTVLPTLSRVLDDLVRNGADSQYVAAGNSGNAACVGAPATAWNIVSVGAFDDKNTNGWSDDTMAAFSSGADPGSDNGDRQEPDLAAPGVNFTGLLPSQGGGATGNVGSGTSYATPVMVGGAAMAGEKAPFLLGFPETEKAVMMASACHNIEGSQVNSELDGAGGPDFLEMYNLVVANRFRGDSIPNGSGVAISQTFPSVTVGQEMRVALAWDTNTSYSLYDTDPSDDLDLVLRRPDGTVAASSSSFDNTNETIEFVADAAGTWTIEVNRFRTSDPAGATFAGLAWHKYAPSACTAP